MIVVALAGCVTRLPPPPPPPAVVPQVIQNAPPPAAGQGRLVVDVVDGPAPVQRLGMDPQAIQTSKGRPAVRFFETPRVLCPASPCVTEMAPGNVLLGFPVIGDNDSTEVELVNVGPETSVYRRSLSQWHQGDTSLFGILMTSIGGASLMTGSALLPIGLAQGNGGMTTAGALTLGGGALMLVLGIWRLRATASTYRPGASFHFVVQ